MAVGAPGNGPRHVFAIIVGDVGAVCVRTANFQDPDGYVWEIATQLPDAQG